jgi:hypothetical protein
MTPFYASSIVPLGRGIILLKSAWAEIVPGVMFCVQGFGVSISLYTSSSTSRNTMGS